MVIQCVFFFLFSFNYELSIKAKAIVFCLEKSVCGFIHDKDGVLKLGVVMNGERCDRKVFCCCYCFQLSVFSGVDGFCESQIYNLYMVLDVCFIYNSCFQCNYVGDSEDEWINERNKGVLTYIVRVCHSKIRFFMVFLYKCWNIETLWVFFGFVGENGTKEKKYIYI